MDEKDRLILSLMQNNGRISFSEIGKVVGLTAMGAKKRVEKLLKDKVKVKALVNTDKLQLAMIAMEVENSDYLRKILNRFQNCPRIIRFFVTTGSYNLFAIIFAEDYKSLKSVTLEKCSLRAQEGVKRYEVYPIIEIYYEPFLDIKVVANKQDYTPCGISCSSCKSYTEVRCLGCPASKMYRGLF